MIGEIFGQSQSGIPLLLTSADRAPKAFLEHLLGIVIEIAREQRSEDGYRDQVFRFRHGGDVFSIDAALLRGLETAMAKLAETAPDEFRRLAADLAPEGSETLDYLVAAGFGSGDAELADDAIGFLLSDPRRLHLGTFDSTRAASRAVIANASQHCSDTQLSRLEDNLLDLYPPWEHSKEGLRFMGHAQHELLSAVPPDRLSDRGRRRVQELDRKFDGDRSGRSGRKSEKRPVGIRSGFVQSPVPDTAADKMTDDQWLAAFAKYSRGAKATRDFLVGGPDELANLFASEFKKAPERFAALAGRFDDGWNSAYLDAALRAAAGEARRIPTDLLWQLCRKASLNPRGETLKAICRLIQAAAAQDVPADILELVLTAARDRDPNHEPWKESWSGRPVDGGDPLMSGINSVRGSAAEAIASLLAINPARREPLDTAIRALVSDRSPSVRAVAGRILMSLMEGSPDLALQLFEELIATDDEVLTTHYVRRLTYQVFGRSPGVVLPVIGRCLQSSADSVRRLGGELAGFATLLDTNAEHLGEIALGGDDETRTGLAEILAVNLGAAMKPLARQWLTKLFDDESATVQQAAAQAFWRIDAEALPALKDVCLAFIASRAFDQHAGDLIRALARAPGNSPAVVRTLAERFLVVAGDKAGDIRYREAADVEELNSLLLQAYAQTDNEEERSLLLDLIDGMLRVNAYRVDEALREFERRPV